MFDDTPEDRIQRLGGGNDSVTEADVKALNNGCRIVYQMLSDRQWHYGPEIDRLPIQDPKRRLRELRHYGFELQEERVEEASMTWRYRWTGRMLAFVPPPFSEYLNSDEWRELATRIADRDGWRCRNCGAVERLQCHHLTYVRFGRESADDLVTLCESCHRAVHKFVVRRGRPPRTKWQLGFPSYDDLAGLTAVPPPRCNDEDAD